MYFPLQIHTCKTLSFPEKSNIKPYHKRVIHVFSQCPRTIRGFSNHSIASTELILDYIPEPLEYDIEPYYQRFPPPQQAAAHCRLLNYHHSKTPDHLSWVKCFTLCEVESCCCTFCCTATNVQYNKYNENCSGQCKLNCSVECITYDQVCDILCGTLQCR